MILDFTVSNFRSIKDEARLSFVAGQGKELWRTNVIDQTSTRGLHSLPVLRSAVIYGANAAGKSNLVRALQTMRSIVVNLSRPIHEIPITPFRFDPTYSHKPTKFEVNFVTEGIRYQYGFEATTTTVVGEWLFAWPHGRVQKWFVRRHTGDNEFDFGDRLTGNRVVWSHATRSDTLFLPTAVQLNCEQMQPAYNWFAKHLRVSPRRVWSRFFSVNRCRTEEKSDIVQFLQSADLAISDINVVEEDDASRRGRTAVRFTHDLPEGMTSELDLADESDGTQRIFALAGPWLDALDKGYVVVIDELHSNLHPQLVEHLVQCFHNPTINHNFAQLLFTTHETSILSQEIFRRDQVWFCERNEQQETMLYPLSTFRPRKGVENLERAYLSGRYGAVPFLPSDNPISQ